MSLTLAETAIEYARNCVPMKSDNKGYGQMGPAPQGKAVSPQLKMDRNFAMLRLKNATPQSGCSMNDVVEYGRKVAHEKAGNCMEQCSAAAVYLSWQLKDGGGSFDLVYLESPGDHIFIVLGQAHEDGRYPNDFADWSEDAVICDPWAKIACYARDYPEQWQAKMQKWATRGLELSRKSDQGGGWMSPTDSFWLNAVTANGKLSYTA